MLCLQRGEDDGFYYTIITGAPVHEASQLNIFNTVKHGCCRHKKALKRTLIVLVLLSILLCALAFAAIHGAARLFNHTMSRQTMLRGTITVETLAPHITGYVQFTNLVWKDPDGHLILYVPDGSLSVRPWDIITRSIKSTTLTNITLNNATIAAYFDEKNQLDLIAQDEKEKKDGTEKRQPFSGPHPQYQLEWPETACLTGSQQLPAGIVSYEPSLCYGKRQRPYRHVHGKTG